LPFERERPSTFLQGKRTPLAKAPESRARADFHGDESFTPGGYEPKTICPTTTFPEEGGNDDEILLRWSHWG
jgi:hypothetical protein